MKTPEESAEVFHWQFQVLWEEVRKQHEQPKEEEEKDPR